MYNSIIPRHKRIFVRPLPPSSSPLTLFICHRAYAIQSVHTVVEVYTLTRLWNRYNCLRVRRSLNTKKKKKRKNSLDSETYIMYNRYTNFTLVFIVKNLFLYLYTLKYWYWQYKVLFCIGRRKNTPYLCKWFILLHIIHHNIIPIC